LKQITRVETANTPVQRLALYEPVEEKSVSLNFLHMKTEVK